MRLAKKYIIFSPFSFIYPIDLDEVNSSNSVKKFCFSTSSMGKKMCIRDRNDIERATGIANKMVTRYGMSDKLGPIAVSYTHL